MLIIGDLSGIQDYLFDVANEGGQQARRLRSRSFFIQLAAECIALRVMKAVGSSKDDLLFCSAGKFLIKADSSTEEQRQALSVEQRRMSEWLLGETNGQLRLALAMSDPGDTPQTLYQNVEQKLQREKLRALAATSVRENKWRPDSLILNPLDKPCALCQRRTGDVEEPDNDTNETRLVCRRCQEDLKLGIELPQTNWIKLSEPSQAGAKSFELPGWVATLHLDRPPLNSAPLIHLTSSEKDFATFDPHVIKLACIREIPRAADGNVIGFKALAEKAQGDNLLAVLKADADSLGGVFNKLLGDAKDFSRFSDFSSEMDSFFGIELASELTKHNWELIYPVFAGGDDLLLVGPWNVIFDFAAHTNEMFKQKFGQRELTISAGISFLKWKQPIKYAVEQAADLLEAAKTKPAPRRAETPKDQLAAFGQIWKWSDHAAITKAAKQLTDWVNDGTAERGWLQTLLQLAGWMQRKEDPDANSNDRIVGAMATSRLSYFVARNFPGKKDRDPEKRKLRQWADMLIADFDVANNVETIYLPTIVRYAIMATRAKITRE